MRQTKPRRTPARGTSLRPSVLSLSPLVLDVASRSIVDGTRIVLLHVNGVPCVETQADVGFAPSRQLQDRRPLDRTADAGRRRGRRASHASRMVAGRVSERRRRRRARGRRLRLVPLVQGREVPRRRSAVRRPGRRTEDRPVSPTTSRTTRTPTSGAASRTKRTKPAWSD